MNFKESEKIELKKTFSEWKEAIIALCAFANKKGGKVIIGMSDDGVASGI
jgi:predicted HTH transcriptional regulator